MASIPEDDSINVVTRIQQSAYKRVLNSLPLGSEIKLAGPTGLFTLHEDSNVPAVFIAGGIGIAPFYSMIRHAIKNASSQLLFLFYGNQQPDDAAFLKELVQLQNKNPQFKLIATMDKPNDAWQGETGFITDELIKKYIPDLTKPMYYVCGSPVMVTTLQETLAEMNIDEEKIRVEDFPGY